MTLQSIRYSLRANLMGNLALSAILFGACALGGVYIRGLIFCAVVVTAITFVYVYMFLTDRKDLVKKIPKLLSQQPDHKIRETTLRDRTRRYDREYDNSERDAIPDFVFEQALVSLSNENKIRRLNGVVYLVS